MKLWEKSVIRCYIMPNSVHSHEEARKKVCCVCYRKSDQKMSAFIILMVQILVNVLYDLNNPQFAAGLCSTCNIRVHQHSRVNSYGLPELSIHSFATAGVLLPTITRSTGTCSCDICSIARSRARSGKKAGRPRYFFKTLFVNPFIV